MLHVLFIDTEPTHVCRRLIPATRGGEAVPHGIYGLLDSRDVARIDLRPNTDRVGVAAWISLDAVGTKPMNTQAAIVIAAIAGDDTEATCEIEEDTPPVSTTLWEPPHLYPGHVVITGLAWKTDTPVSLPEHVFDQVAAHTTDSAL